MKKKKKKRERGRTNNSIISLPADDENIYQEAARHLLKAIEKAEKDKEKFQNPSEVFDDALETLKSLCSTVHNFNLLCILCSNFLTTTNLANYSELRAAPRLTQGHLEVLQAMMILWKNPGDLPHNPSQYEIAISALEEIFIAFPLKRKVEAKQALSVEESMRMHTQSIRNMGYPQQLKRITTEIFRPIDSRSEDLAGYRFSEVVEWLFAIEASIENRLSEHFQKFLPVLIARTKKEAIDAATELYPGQNLDSFLQSLPLIAIKYSIQKHRELQLLDCYSLAISDLLACYPASIDKQRIAELANKISLAVGEIDKPINFLFMDNPIRKKPLIKLSERKWCCPIPNLLIGECLPILEAISSEPKALKQAVEKQRSTFLEVDTEKLFKKAFPKGDVFRNAKFKIPDSQVGEPAEGETDVVALLPPYLVTINCKAHRIPDEAKRGAPSLKEIIKKIIVEPAIQSQIFIEQLRKQGELQLKTSSGTVTLNSADYTANVSLSIVLEALPSQLSNIPTLVAANLIAENAPRATVMPVTDLECFLEILPTESQRLHYLVMREILEQEKPFISDELGLLKLYLDSSLLEPISDLYNEVGLIEMYGHYFDPYFMQEWTGIKARKPKQRLSPLSITILNWLEDKQPINWRSTGQALLHYGPKKLLWVEKRLHQLLKLSRKSHRKLTNNIIRLATHDRLELPALLFVIHPDRGDLNEYMNNLANETLLELKTDSVTIILFNPEDYRFPITQICNYSESVVV